jgi:hypothetical protein
MSALPAEINIEADWEAAQRVAERLVDRHAEDVRSRIKVTPQAHLRASSFGYKCDRRLYHDVRDWQTKRPVDPHVQQYFDRGNDQEPLIERILSRLGFRIIQSQVALFDKELKISGHPDGIIAEDEIGGRIVVDIKSTLQANLLSCRDADDLKANQWGLRYYTQVMIYMRAQGIGAGMLILWDAQNWRPVPAPFAYDAEFVRVHIEERARRLNDHLDRNDPPAHIQDSRECRHCPHFGLACNPPISFGAGAQILTDEELLDDIERHRELEPIGKEFAQLDTRIKARLKDPNKDDPSEGIFIIGPYEIRRTIGSRTGYEVRPSKPQKIEWEKVK